MRVSWSRSDACVVDADPEEVPCAALLHAICTALIPPVLSTATDAREMPHDGHEEQAAASPPADEGCHTLAASKACSSMPMSSAAASGSGAADHRPGAPCGSGASEGAHDQPRSSPAARAPLAAKPNTHRGGTPPTDRRHCNAENADINQAALPSGDLEQRHNLAAAGDAAAGHHNAQAPTTRRASSSWPDRALLDQRPAHVVAHAEPLSAQQEAETPAAMPSGVRASGAKVGRKRRRSRIAAMQPGLDPLLCASARTPDSGTSVTSAQHLPALAPPPAQGAIRRRAPGRALGRAATQAVAPQEGIAHTPDAPNATPADPLVAAPTDAHGSGARVQRSRSRGRALCSSADVEPGSESGMRVDTQTPASCASAYDAHASFVRDGQVGPTPDALLGGTSAHACPAAGRAPCSSLQQQALSAMAAAGISAAEARAAARDQRSGGARRLGAMCEQAGLVLPDAPGPPATDPSQRGARAAAHTLARGLGDVNAALRATSSHAELVVELSGFSPAERRSTAGALHRLGVSLQSGGNSGSRCALQSCSGLMLNLALDAERMRRGRASRLLVNLNGASTRAGANGLLRAWWCARLRA